jgi:hypothetical protein
VTMNGARAVTAVFAPASAIDIALNTSPAGLSVLADDVLTATPATVHWVPGSQHTLAVPSPQIKPGGGTQNVFQSWSDGGAISHTVTAPTAAASFTATFNTQYFLTVISNPSTGGSVSGGGYYTSGSPVNVQATANAGFTFTGFSGDLTGTTNPQSITMNGPKTVTAAFTGSNPTLYAMQGPRLDATDPNQRLVQIYLVDANGGIAANAQITSITNITVTAGSGDVSIFGPSFPVLVGTLNPGDKLLTTLTFNWPASATRVSFRVNFSANNGNTTGSTTLTIYR